ncbi:hypothetical protein T01_9146 [Trichinella spiralis]|uniref:Uncharacterized protein n=1 Tax=Trichinella spiralis TaxID=6334 RepID=A0A0V1BUJ1_TRISP|nr:hypothetical protein T01_9146 [Trichinella spiralis]
MWLSDPEEDVRVLCTRSNIRLRKTSTVWCTTEVLHSLISEQSVMETFVQQRNEEMLLPMNDLRRINNVYARKQG